MATVPQNNDPSVAKGLMEKHITETKILISAKSIKSHWEALFFQSKNNLFLSCETIL